MLQAIEEEKRKTGEKRKITNDDSSETVFISPREILTRLFIKAVASAYPDAPSSVVTLVPTANAKFGDYQCNAAMPICQTLKSSGTGLYFAIKHGYKRSLVNKDCDIMSSLNESCNCLPSI